jgi:hypothetical protein
MTRCIQDTATKTPRHNRREGPRASEKGHTVPRSGVVRRLQQLWLTKLQTPEVAEWAYGAAVKII